MAKLSPEVLGTESIGKLLVKQAIPASIGILVMSLNVLVDSVFVGNWIGTTAIAAINVVLPVSFFIVHLRHFFATHHICNFFFIFSNIAFYMVRCIQRFEFS